VVLGGVPFTISPSNVNTFLSQEDAQSDMPTHVALDISVESPTSIYVLANATFCRLPYSGLEIGKFVLHYLDGTTQTVPLIAGQNIREWSLHNADCVDTLSDSHVSEVWTGFQEFEGDPRGRIDMLEIPAASQSTLTGLELFDTSSTSGVESDTADAGIFVRGITVSTVPEPSSILVLLCGVGGLGWKIGLKKR